MERNFASLRRSFPTMMASCNCVDFLQAVHDISSAWAQHLRESRRCSMSLADHRAPSACTSATLLLDSFWAYGLPSRTQKPPTLPTILPRPLCPRLLEPRGWRLRSLRTRRFLCRFAPHRRRPSVPCGGRPCRLQLRLTLLSIRPLWPAVRRELFPSPQGRPRHCRSTPSRPSLPTSRLLSPRQPWHRISRRLDHRRPQLQTPAS